MKKEEISTKSLRFISNCFRHLGLPVIKQCPANNHNNLVIPATKYFISDRHSDKKVLKIFIHEQFITKHYLDKNYTGIVLQREDGKYYEIIRNHRLFVKKNIRVEDYIKNALDNMGKSDDITMSKYATKSILSTENFIPKLFSHNLYLTEQITIYIHIGLFLWLLRRHSPTKNFSKIIRNILYRSLGFVKTIDFDYRPKIGGRKDVA